jgi:hypothetical protein
MKNCRDCGHEVSETAFACPNCGAPFPYKEKWDGWGYEYKSAATVMGLPLLHISFKYRPNGMPVPAKGVIAVGQFGIGILNISQAGVGVVSLSQFTIAGFAVCQFGIAYSLLAQIGLYWDRGCGQFVKCLKPILSLMSGS